MCYSGRSYGDGNKGSDNVAVPNKNKKKQGPSPTPKGTKRPKARSDVKTSERSLGARMYSSAKQSLFRKG